MRVVLAYEFFFLLRTRENFKKKNVDNLTLFLHRTWADMHAQTVDPYRVEGGQKVFPLAFSDQTYITWTIRGSRSFAKNPTFPSTEISENKVATAANTNQAYPQRTTHWGMAGHVLRDPGYNIKVQHFWGKAGFFCKMSFQCPQIVKFLIKYANFS